MEDVTVEGCDFSGVDLSRMKTMRGVEFRDCDFTRASLAGFEFGVGGYRSSNTLIYTNLSNCQMEQADFRTSKVVLASFDGANIKGAWFRKEQVECITLSSMQLNEVKGIGEELVAVSIDDTDLITHSGSS